MSDYDVIVVGAGNAALAAAVSARESGATKTVVLEKAPKDMRGGNTHWSGGLLRIAFNSVEDLDELVPEAEKDFPGFRGGIEPYKAEDFWDDLLRVTGGRTDRELAEIVISNSYDTICWMHKHAGIPMEPAFSLGGIRKGDVIKWPKGAIIRAEHEGVGLSKHWFLAAERDGIEVRYNTGAQELLVDGSGAVYGVSVKNPEGIKKLTAKSVVLACGGFEANQQWRAQYLGKPWDHAKVRGTRYNQGDGLRMALNIGAMAYGNWSSCHSTPISAEWDDFAPRDLTNKSNRLSYPWGVMINLKGLRFCDEGEDFQFFTYARYGRVILDQPNSKVWQIYDQKTVHLLEPRYETSDPVTGGTLEELIGKLDIEDKEQALRTLQDYNAAAHSDENFDPSELDGLAANGISPKKSNWAIKIDKPPFVAYSATGGITFTFGGLRINDKAQVIGVDWQPINGLFCAGEMVGGLFHNNYPGGTGLVSGAVFGRIAGRNAAFGVN
ncbi:fumarate reductase flavoprotein subunit [bacterium MnTg02]|nr:fumarate reductase flavoprotein subunit [bacterium MnTg02]